MRSYKNIFSLFLIVLLVFTAWWVVKVVVMDGNRLYQKKAELALLEQKIDVLNQTVEYYPVVKNQYTTVVTNFDTLKYSISTHDNYVDVLEKIRNSAKRQDIRILSLSPDLNNSFPAIKDQLTTTQKYIERIPVHLQILGDYITITSLIDELTRGPEVINVGGVTIESELEMGGKLSGELLLYTYWLVDDGGQI